MTPCVICKFVAAGSNIGIVISSTGATWQKTSLPKQGAFYKLAKSKDAIIAVGVDGVIMRSGDAKAWSIIPTGITEAITDVSYGSGIFVAFTEKGSMLRSVDDGKTWEIYKFDEARKPRNISYGNGMFLLKTDEIPNYQLSHLYSSADGITWQEVRTEEAFLRHITSLTFVNGNFIATTTGMKILSSSDGREWSSSPIKVFGGFNAITYGSNSYVAVGENGQIIQSEAIR